MVVDSPSGAAKLDKFIRKQCVTDAPPCSLKELLAHHAQWAHSRNGVAPLTLRELRSALEERGYRVDKGAVATSTHVRDKVVRVHGLAHKSAPRAADVTAFMELRSLHWPGRAVQLQDMWVGYRVWARAAGRPALARHHFRDTLREAGYTVESVAYAEGADGVQRDTLVVRDVACPGLRGELELIDRRERVESWVRSSLEPGPLGQHVPVRVAVAALRRSRAGKDLGVTRGQFLAILQGMGYQVQRTTYVRCQDGTVVRNADAIVNVRFRAVPEGTDPLAD